MKTNTAFNLTKRFTYEDFFNKAENNAMFPIYPLKAVKSHNNKKNYAEANTQKSRSVKINAHISVKNK